MAQQTATFFDPKQETEVKRRRLLADQLSKKAEEIPLGNEVVSGIVVKRSPIEGLSKALQMGLGGYAQGKASEKEAELEASRNQNIQRALASYGSNPKQAAMMLGQDPQNAAMALELMKGEVDYGRDQSRFEQEMALKREIENAGYAREDAKWEKDAELKRELARMRDKTNDSYVDPDTGEIIQGYSSKPLPVGALKLQNEAIDSIGAASGVSELTGQLIGQVEQGQLELSPVNNFINSARNWAGMSSDESVNFANMKTGLEKLRNDTLRLNKGVQTEGDAERAMNEVLQSVNDPKVFKAAMQKLDAVNQRAAELQKVQVNTIRQNYNASPYDFDQLQGLPSPVAPTGGENDKAAQMRQYLSGKGMSPQQIDAYLQSKGM